jgi:N-hydroxyarylamine O-acetyltransferase
MDVSRYLDRLNYRGSREVSSEALRELHKAHMLTVPFENLDIHLGRPIVLEEEKLVRKIVDGRRGGFCYELNGAFCALLRAMGFQVSMLSAGVAREGGGFDPPFDHMALLVKLEDRWLADVGFGDSFREPLLLDERSGQDQNGDTHRLVEDAEHLVLHRRVEGEWRPQYRFTLKAYQLEDFSEMCRYHQTSPKSPFTQRRTCSRATPGGRITVTGMRLIISDGGKREERDLASDEEWFDVLRKHFGIYLEETT